MARKKDPREPRKGRGEPGLARTPILAALQPAPGREDESVIVRLQVKANTGADSVASYNSVEADAFSSLPM